MPFKSKAQRRKFAQLLVDGKISDETYEEWNRSTGGKALPERVGKKAAKRPAKKRPTQKRPAKTPAATTKRASTKRATTRRAAKKSTAKRPTRRG